VNNLHRQRV